MKEDWEIKKIGDVCDRTSNINWQEYQEINFKYIDLTAVSRETLRITNSVLINSTNAPSRARKILNTNDVIFATTRPTLKRIAKINKQFNNQICSTGYVVLRSNRNEIEPEFIFYYLQTEIFMKRMESIQRGTSYPAVTDKDVKETDIPKPKTIEEQKHIVAKLDKVFEAIDKARTNVEKNLNNAKELFQSKLNEIFSQKGDSWVEKKLGDCIKLKSGDGLTAKKMNQNGQYPVYGGNGIAGNHDKYNLEGSQVIVGRVGALCGNVRFINEKIWLTDNAFKVSEYFEEFDNSFLTYLLNYKNLREYARQAAQPVISNSSTKDILLRFPTNIETQRKIVNQLDELKEQTQSLESKYQQELDALDELKKSILQKAFEGEL